MNMGPLTAGRGPGSKLWVPQVAHPPRALTCEELDVFSRFQTGMRPLKDFQKFNFF